MDYMEKINELRAKKSKILSDAEAQIAAGNFEDAGKASEEMEGINASIAQLERLHAAAAGRAEPVGGYDGVLHASAEGKAEDKTAVRPFASLGEQLKAIYAARGSTRSTPRRSARTAAAARTAAFCCRRTSPVRSSRARCRHRRCSTAWIATPAPPPPTRCAG